jgi:hypothetical protein
MPGLDMDPDRVIYHVIDTEDVDVTEADEQFTDDSRVGFHRGSPF